MKHLTPLRRLNIRLTDEVYDKLRDLADGDRRSLQVTTVRAIEVYLASRRANRKSKPQ